MSKKVMVLGVWSSIFLFPLMALANNGQIVDPLNPDVVVVPLDPGSDNGSNDLAHIESKKAQREEKQPEESISEETASTEEQVEERQEAPKKKIKFDNYFFDKDVALSHHTDVIPNDDDYIPHTLFSEILGSLSGRLIFGRC